MLSFSSCARDVTAIFPSVDPPHDLLLRSAVVICAADFNNLLKIENERQHELFKLGPFSRQKASSSLKTIDSSRPSSLYETVSYPFGLKALTSLCVQ